MIPGVWTLWAIRWLGIASSGPHRRPGFNVIDDCSREALAIEVDTSLSSKRITKVLDQIGLSRGFPKAIRSDNGPEFTSKDFAIWCVDKNIEIRFIQPGKPTQNGFIEIFNRLYREAVLDAYLFFALDQIRQLTTEWIDEYNNRRPHEGLSNMTPFEWKDLLLKKKNQQEITVWKMGYLQYSQVILFKYKRNYNLNIKEMNKFINNFRYFLIVLLSRRVSLFWWSHSGYRLDKIDNFGDMMSPYIVRKLTGKYPILFIPSSRFGRFLKHYFSIGSIRAPLKTQ